MADLILDSLEIRNFRAFRHLRIEQLGRVNLITGKNNVGKSCLLEAIWIYICNGRPNFIFDMLEKRREISSYKLSHFNDVTVAGESGSAAKHLFFGRRDVDMSGILFSIGRTDSESSALSVSIKPYVWRQYQDGLRQLQPYNADMDNATSALVPTLVVERNGRVWFVYHLDQMIPKQEISGQFGPVINPGVFVYEGGLESAETGVMWDRIALSDLERDVVAALKIIEPDIEGVNLRGNLVSSDERTPIVRIKNYDTPIPLRSMGEGMNRLFGIVLALVNAKDGFLLIDEVETGIHYSVLPEVWRLIFEVAQRLNVQVFATTHSWDCIQAFQQAADENTGEEGLLIRLENREGEVTVGGEVSATLFDERKLTIATREHIEVR